MSKVDLCLVFIFCLFFAVPFIGKYTLDYRFEKASFNSEKPYAQKLLGQRLGQLTNESDIVVTNMDTWGAWYGNRRTILIPTDFVLLQKLDSKIPISVIFLSDYQKGNQDHPLAGNWLNLFDSKISENKFVDDNFKLVNIATISASEVYEKENFTFKLWVRR